MQRDGGYSPVGERTNVDVEVGSEDGNRSYPSKCAAGTRRRGPRLAGGRRFLGAHGSERHRGAHGDRRDQERHPSGRERGQGWHGHLRQPDPGPEQGRHRPRPAGRDRSPPRCTPTSRSASSARTGACRPASPRRGRSTTRRPPARSPTRTGSSPRPAWPPPWRTRSSTPSRASCRPLPAPVPYVVQTIAPNVPTLPSVNLPQLPQVLVPARPDSRVARRRVPGALPDAEQPAPAARRDADRRPRAAGPAGRVRSTTPASVRPQLSPSAVAAAAAFDPSRYYVPGTSLGGAGPQRQRQQRLRWRRRAATTAPRCRCSASSRASTAPAWTSRAPAGGGLVVRRRLAGAARRRRWPPSSRWPR